MRGKRHWRVTLILTDDEVQIESGPHEGTARGHEGMGGGQPLYDFLAKPHSMFEEFPDALETIRAALKRR